MSKELYRFAYDFNFDTKQLPDDLKLGFYPFAFLKGTSSGHRELKKEILQCMGYWGDIGKSEKIFSIEAFKKENAHLYKRVAIFLISRNGLSGNAVTLSTLKIGDTTYSPILLPPDTLNIFQSFRDYFYHLNIHEWGHVLQMEHFLRTPAEHKNVNLVFYNPNPTIKHILKTHEVCNASIMEYPENICGPVRKCITEGGTSYDCIVKGLPEVTKPGYLDTQKLVELYGDTLARNNPQSISLETKEILEKTLCQNTTLLHYLDLLKEEKSFTMLNAIIEFSKTNFSLFAVGGGLGVLDGLITNISKTFHLFEDEISIAKCLLTSMLVFYTGAYGEAIAISLTLLFLQRHSPFSVEINAYLLSCLNEIGKSLFTENPLSEGLIGISNVTLIHTGLNLGKTLVDVGFWAVKKCFGKTSIEPHQNEQEGKDQNMLKNI